MNNNPGITLIAAVSFATDAHAVTASYNVVNVLEVAAGSATITTSVDLDADSDIITCSSPDLDTLLVVGAAIASSRTISVTMLTSSTGAAGDGPVTVMVHRVNPGLGEATYTP